MTVELFSACRPGKREQSKDVLSAYMFLVSDFVFKENQWHAHEGQSNISTLKSHLLSNPYFPLRRSAAAQFNHWEWCKYPGILVMRENMATLWLAQKYHKKAGRFLSPGYSTQLELVAWSSGEQKVTSCFYLHWLAWVPVYLEVQASNSTPNVSPMTGYLLSKTEFWIA